MRTGFAALARYEPLNKKAKCEDVWVLQQWAHSPGDGPCMTWLTKGKARVSVMELVMCLTWNITIIFMALFCIICTSLCLHKKCRCWRSACTCVKETISRGMSTWIFCDLYIVN